MDEKASLLRNLQLLHLTAHDAKNPISAALANLAFVEETSPPEGEAGEALQDAVEAIRRVRKILDDTVFIAKREAAPSEPRRQPTSLDELVRALVEGAEKDAALRRVTIARRVEEGVSAKADAQLLARALEVLLETSFRWVRAEGRILVGAERRHGVVAVFVAHSANSLHEQPRAKAYVTHGAASPEKIGLALYYAHCVATAHRGTFTIGSSAEWPTEMVIALPHEGVR